jgi:hypothetical protein
MELLCPVTILNYSITSIIKPFGLFASKDPQIPPVVIGVLVALLVAALQCVT